MKIAQKNSFARGTILITFLGFMGIILIGIGGIIQLVNTNQKENRNVKFKRQALYLAEAGVELAITELNQNTSYTDEIISLPNPAPVGWPTVGQAVISVTGSGNSRTITSTGYAPSLTQALGTYQVRVNAVGTAGGGAPITFNFGAQVGDSGIIMDNNSTITGNVFSNGPVLGGSNTTISGSVVSAGATGLVRYFTLGIAGNVTANTFRDVTVAGNAIGKTCRNATVSGNVSADTIISCTITGTITPGVADTPPQPLPITQAQIDGWKSVAEAGGVQTGNLDVTTNTSLGPKKIVGNLTVANNVTLTITGTVWPTGNITLDNGATVRLDPSYGSNDGLMIADGNIHLNNTVIVQGSGQPDSYLMLLSTAIGTAIDLDNNAQGAILYAANGTINIDNNGTVKQATGQGFHLNNNARLIFESGINNSNFIDVPVGSTWSAVKGTYQKL